MSEEATEVILLVNHKVDHDRHYGPSLRVTAKPVLLVDGTKVRNPTWRSWGRKGWEALDDLQYQGYVNAKDILKGARLTGRYGGSPEYRDVFSVDLEHAEAMVKVLRKLRQGLDKLQQEWSDPGDFAQELLRFARVLQIKTFAFYTHRSRHFYDESRFWFTTEAPSVGFWLDARFGEFKKEHVPEDKAS